MANTIVIAGSLAQKPHQAGHSWVLLQYILGFRELGWDVVFLDQLTPEMCVDRQGRQCPLETSLNLKVFRRIMGQFGLEGCHSLVFDDGARFIGMSRELVVEAVRQSAFLFNIMGYFDNEEILGHASRRVFLDIDPGFGQMWEALGLSRSYDGYDDFVTIGERIGSADCPIPQCGRSWITTPQPVTLSNWGAAFSHELRSLSSIVSWRGAYGPVEYQGRTYGLRVHEFRKFMDLPARTGQRFQLALAIHPADHGDLEGLKRNGWQILEPTMVAGDTRAYRKFIRESSAELMIAKNMYVDTRCGWFSDRSICYLASGKPVIAQDTGLGSLYPCGEGLLLFATRDDAVECVQELRGNYSRHARKARELAEEYFDSAKVLGRLLAKLNIG